MTKSKKPRSTSGKRVARNKPRTRSAVSNNESTSDARQNRIRYRPMALGETVASGALGMRKPYSITNKEFIGTLNNKGNSGFYIFPESSTTPGYDINPGNTVMFPWLSSIAKNYEKYRFTKLSFKFVSSCATTTDGRYYVSVDYDWDDNVPTTKQEMMLTQTAMECPMWQGMTLKCSPSVMNADMPYRFVQHGVRVDPEPRTLYGGFLTIAFDTNTTYSQVDFWVEYTVQMINPQYISPAVVSTWDSSSSFTSYSSVIPVGTSGASRVIVPTVLGHHEDIKAVVPGVNGVPNISVNGTAATYALDIGKCMSGLYSAFCELTETGQTPNTVLGKAAKLAATVYSADGSLLGSVDDATNGGTNTWGPKNYSEMSTASAKYRVTLSVVLDALKAVFPTAKYLIPALYASSAVGAGTAYMGERIA